MQQQAHRLAKLNAVLRRRHGVSIRQAAQLCDEKVELETRLSAKEGLIAEMREHVHRSSGDNHLPQSSYSVAPSMTASLMSDPCSSPVNPVSKCFNLARAYS